MRGIVYGVGVGPGDPELMTVKAVRLIKENEVIAVPGMKAEESTAYKIAVKAVPQLADKTLLPVPMPMSREKERLKQAHREGAALIERWLDRGENVVYLTLGDPTVYCSFSYLQHILEEDGYFVELVSGIPSFCAASARLNRPLVKGDEPLHVLPGGCIPAGTGVPCPEGTIVLMKTGGRMQAVKEWIRRSGREAAAVINCGMETEQVCRTVSEIPDDAGYFSLVISGSPEEENA